METKSIDLEGTADSQAIAAIRDGDRERYRELVERYAPKVFAVAWSRLGDRALAEEAAQETFIAGYRRLSLLGRAERFGAWISTIARHTAINLGIRHRGELARRERWALENPGVESPPDPAPDEGPAGTLQAALNELPSAHRECLVLFYLEGRSTAEAARSLGISENAFRVRLHRARAVLRDALEHRLETGLERLRPSDRFAGMVMLALPAQPASFLAWGGLGPALAKLLPISFLLSFAPLLGALPGLFFAAWLGRRDLANFREPQGFRAQTYRHRSRRMIAAIVIFMVALGLLIRQSSLKQFAAIFGCLAALSTVDAFRRTHVVRHRIGRLSAWALAVTSASLLGVGFLGWPVTAIFAAQAIYFVLYARLAPDLVPRMDESLFLRAAHGLLPGGNEGDSPKPLPSAGQGSASSTLAFARFLADRLLVDHWKRHSGGLVLRAGRVGLMIPFVDSLFPWWNASKLVLHDDGRVEAVLGTADARGLHPTAPAQPAALLESKVSRAVQEARMAFERGDLDSAALLFGETPPDTVFVEPHRRSPALRWRVATMYAGAVVAAFGAFASWSNHSGDPEMRHASRLTVPKLTEPEVRDFLASLDPAASNHHRAYLEGWGVAVSGHGICLPHPSLLGAATLTVVRSNATQAILSETNAIERVAVALANGPFLRMFANGFFTPDDLARLGLDPARVRAGLLGMTPPRRAEIAKPLEGPSQGYPYRAVDVRWLADRVLFLRQAGALDLVDVGPVLERLAARQIRPGPQPPDAWPVADARLVAGLFNLRDGALLRETLEALTIFEAAGALDRIDGPSCVEGILRIHRGRGLFTVPHPESLGPNGSRVQGEARDTWAAFASLRLLGALDRVRDLERWEFRSPFQIGTQVRHPDGTRTLIEEPFEAWWMAHRFGLEVLPKR